MKMPSSELTKVGVALTFGGALGAFATYWWLHGPTNLTKTKTKSKTTKLAPKGLQLLVYDHCPFCVRARMIFGLKKIPFELVFLANADEATPIGLVGSKQVPILVTPEGHAMPESMEIVRFVDQQYGGKVLLLEASGRQELADWIQKTAHVWRLLYHPRFHAAQVLPEFAQQASRDYYRIKKEKTIGNFEHAIQQTPELLVQANAALNELADLFVSDTSVNGHGISYDDIDFFGRLRGLTLVKELQWPTKLRNYIDHMAAITDIPLYDDLASM